MDTQYQPFTRMTIMATALWGSITLLAPITAYADTQLPAITVSEGRQLSVNAEEVSEQADNSRYSTASTKQKNALKKQVLDKQLQHQIDLSAGKVTPRPMTRKQITAQRSNGIMSENALQSLSTIQTQSASLDAKSSVQFSRNSSSKIQKVQLDQQSIVGYRDFEIFEAYSRLFDDVDEDGFYQTFSVTFDADVYGFTVGEAANVYGELYLSRNGGPWEHYYSTEVFTIYGNNTDDDYEVLTTLAQGYQTDYYDVLIDLYELGYDDIVATLSSEESDGLYALPLESSDRDAVYEEEYVEVIESEVIVSGGAMAWGVLLMLIVIGFRRAQTVSLL